MIRIDRRSFVAGASMMMLARPAHAARAVTDSAGRTVRLPDRVDHVFAAGGPASVVVYTMRPETMVGWPRALRAEERPFIALAQRDLPEVGLLTGRGDTANVEIVLKMKPDLIVDYGSVRQTFATLADSVQQRTGIPYVLIDGRFEATAASFRLLGDIFGSPDRGEALARYSEDLFKRLDATLATVPEDQRPRVYLARGPNGLETGLRGSINTEIIERAGGRNVADAQDQRRGIANVSPKDHGWRSALAGRQGRQGWPRVPRTDRAVRLDRPAAIDQPVNRTALARQSVSWHAFSIRYSRGHAHLLQAVLSR